MKYNFQVGDLFLSSFPGQPQHTGMIIKFNDKLSYPYTIEWTNCSSGHYKQYEIVDFLKHGSITYFPIVK
jgi:hypothetical protein